MKYRNIYMIGIGGIGMSAIARYFHAKGHEVSGYDRTPSEITASLEAEGIAVHFDERPELIPGDPSETLVIYTPAIPAENRELVFVREKGYRLLKRSRVLGEIAEGKKTIAVAGTHGKTTVTSMITQILILNKMDPTAVIGGKLPLINSNGIAGGSETMVCESCEFVDTFLQLSPDIAVLLNIDNDHLDYFKTMENLTLSFHKFLAMAGRAYINGDDELAKKAAEDINADIVTFGFGEKNIYRAENIKRGKFGFLFDVIKNGEKIISIEMHIPGRHNVLNGLAAFAVCYDMGVPAEGIKDAIQKFTGAGRRFEFLGEYGGFMLADDYAHHPTEIRATLSAAKELDYNRVIAVFQPFTFSRTALLKDEFISALSLADKVILTPIMGSREVNTYGISSEDLAKGLKDAVIADGFENIADTVIKTAGKGDLVITMGGGDIYKAAHIIQKRLG